MHDVTFCCIKTVLRDEEGQSAAVFDRDKTLRDYPESNETTPCRDDTETTRRDNMKKF